MWHIIFRLFTTKLKMVYFSVDVGNKGSPDIHLIKWVEFGPSFKKEAAKASSHWQANYSFRWKIFYEAVKSCVDGKRSQDTKVPSCCSHLMCGNFFTRVPCCELPFGVCNSVEYPFLPGLWSPWLLYLHTPDLGWRGKRFSQLPTCLKEELRGKES